MMKRLVSLALFVGFAAPPLDAQAGRIAFDTFSLANGLQVIASQDHSTPVVSVDVWYNVGSRNERPGRSGFAHLFEHMMFQGSAHVKKAEHFQLVMRAGGTMNGTTAEDRTNYFETLPSNQLALGLWLEADRMRSLAITQENFENQRETVKEERRLGVDNRPYARGFLDAITWPFDSASCFAYAHTVIGSMDDLKAAALPDVQAFFDTYYAVNNATLVVVGDFEPAELRRLAARYFGDLPRRPTPPVVTCESPLSPGARRHEIRDEHANLDAAFRFYRLPPHPHADTPALDLLNIILGQGESSRLHVSVVRRDKAAVAVGTFVNPFGPRRGPGALAVFGIVNQGVDVQRMDSLIAAQVDSVRRIGVTADELIKAKNTFRAGHIRSRETTLDKAEALHHYRMFHGALDEINADLERYLAVTADDVRRAAATYLDPANVVILIIRPGGEGAGGAQ